MTDWTERLLIERPNTIRMTCSVCFRPFWIPPSKIGQRSRCSKECASVVQRKEHYGWEYRLHEPRAGAIAKTCTICGVTFWLPPSKLKERITCSSKCAAIWQKAAHDTFVKTCEACGTIFRPRKTQLRVGAGRYCSRQCIGDVKIARRPLDYLPRRKITRRLREAVSLILVKQKHQCAMCRKSIRRGYHVDHIKPIARGGIHAAKNFQLLCRPCNLKGDYALDKGDPIPRLQE